MLVLNCKLSKMSFNKRLSKYNRLDRNLKGKIERRREGNSIDRIHLRYLKIWRGNDKKDKQIEVSYVRCLTNSLNGKTTIEMISTKKYSNKSQDLLS